MKPRINLLGVGFDDLTTAEVLEKILRRPEDASFVYIVTPNADHFARLRKNADVSAIYRDAYLCLLDSQLISLLTRWLRAQPPRVITGTDLSAAILGRAEGRAATIIGMTGDEFRMLTDRYPRVKFIHHAPPMELSTQPDAFQRAVSFAATGDAAFTFLCLGSPLQERLAQAVSRYGGATGIGLCVGAALQFCAGATPRAPVWMRQAGLEWLYRLCQEPRRLTKRYLWDDPPVLAALIAAKLRRRL